MNDVVGATAPANIALIKYMGKTSAHDNTPSNPSLSWSLNHLVTAVEVASADYNQWEPLETWGFTAPVLSEKGQIRFLAHAERLKKKFEINETLVIRSANNFPADCGVASSASSFAALTKALYAWAKVNRPGLRDWSLEELSALSREGSGSSCRSLFSGWAEWREDRAHAVTLPYSDLAHTLLLLDVEKKQVSSSEAHLRVSTSPHFAERPTRARVRLQQLREALEKKDWGLSFRIVRDEYIDMHELFETSVPSFSYRTDASRKVDQTILSFWEKWDDGPLITMDAGANVHLLWRLDQGDLMKKCLLELREQFPKVQMMSSPHFAEGVRL